MELRLTPSFKAHYLNFGCLLLVFFIAATTCIAQNLGSSLTLDFGYTASIIKDTRHSSIFRTAHGGNLELKYGLQGEKSGNQLGFRFLYAVSDRNGDIVTSVFASELRIFYEHLRVLRNKNWHLGAYIDHDAFVTDRDGGYWFGFDDSPSFSYVTWSSFGLVGKYQKSLNDNWALNIKTALPLLALTERPAYAFVFPEDHYDWNDYFPFLFRSEYFQRAKIQGPTQFTNLQLQTELQHRVGQRGSSISLNYRWSYLFVGGIKPLFRFNHQLGIAYQFSFRKS